MGLKHLKIGFIGVGNMGQAILRAIFKADLVRKENVFASNRSEGKLQKVADEFGIKTFKNNEELIELCDIVIVGVKPQDMTETLESVSSAFHETTILISLAAGITLESLEKLVPQTDNIVRVMPNTPVEMGEAVVGYCLSRGAEKVETTIQTLLEPLGLAVSVPEGEAFEALTVSCGSGTGFVFELMMYWQEWIEEHGFDADVARDMTVQTFKGAALLAQQSDLELPDLQRKVVSKKGVTHAGLESMRELDVARGLRYSFEKAVLRDRELGRPKS